MNCQKRILTNTQHAPSRAQSSRVSPAKSAATNAQPISGGMVAYSNNSANTVSAALSGEENRFARSQASTVIPPSA